MSKISLTIIYLYLSSISSIVSLLIQSHSETSSKQSIYYEFCTVFLFTLIPLIKGMSRSDNGIAVPRQWLKHRTP